MGVWTGLDRLRHDGFSALDGARIGLVCHPASVDSNLNHILDLMEEAGLDVPVVFEPEHGAKGTAQDMEAVVDGGHTSSSSKASTRRFVSLYGDTIESLRPTDEMMDDLDVLVVDLQDVGSRYYTFAVTMRYCMETCAKTGVRMMVLDRPNPLGGLVTEGPLLDDRLRSFVGGFAVPVRHGMTIGELALLAKAEGVDVDLQVVSMKGWERHMWFDHTGLPWVMPSPNMPTLETAVVYPGSCLMEATNLSEGRGTTRPFEFVGAPWIDSKALASELNKAGLLGVHFRPVTFRPMFQKHANKDCHGLEIHVLDRDRFMAFRSGVVLLERLYRQDPDNFQWRSEPYEFVTENPALDLLTGSSDLRVMLEKGGDVESLLGRWQQQTDSFFEDVQGLLLYS